VAIVLQGRVSDGVGNASHWLSTYNSAYEHKTGLRIHPGTLNLALEQEFPLLNPDLSDNLILMRKGEYGGQRDILMLPCILTSLDNLKALIWRTTRAEQVAEDRRILEILAEVNLRQTYGLKNGDIVEITV
jgi:CTP-dependent riboflavin kinase